MRKAFVVFLFALLLPLSANAATCSAGYYLNNGTCTVCDTGSNPVYCPGDDNRYDCPNDDDVVDYEALLMAEYGFWFRAGHLFWATSHNDVTDCVWYHSVQSDASNNIYFTYYYDKNLGRYGPGSFYLYTVNSARDGYYLINQMNSSYYYGIAQCTNSHPANSHYSGPGTPDVGNCPWACDTGYGQTSNNTCEQLCTAGVTGLHTSTGLVFNLYANKQTSPAIHIMPDGTNTICYTSLAPGAANNAVNVEYNGAIYHSTD